MSSANPYADPNIATADTNANANAHAHAESCSSSGIEYLYTAAG